MIEKVKLAQSTSLIQTPYTPAVKDAAKAQPMQGVERTNGVVERPIGMPAPFTDADNHNGKNKVLSPGQDFYVVLNDNPTTGRRWADRINSRDNYFELLDTQFVPGGSGAIGAGGSRVYHFRVKEDATRWHRTEKHIPAALSIYKLAPGESYEQRSTRGDGSGAEFTMNTVIVNERACNVLGLRSRG